MVNIFCSKFESTSLLDEVMGSNVSLFIIKFDDLDCVNNRQKFNNTH